MTFVENKNGSLREEDNMLTGSEEELLKQEPRLHFTHLKDENYFNPDMGRKKSKEEDDEDDYDEEDDEYNDLDGEEDFEEEDEFEDEPENEDELYEEDFDFEDDEDLLDDDDEDVPYN